MIERSVHSGCAACRRFVALAALLVLAGCQSLYFRAAGPPPADPVRYKLHELPYSEYWTGIVFNGEKIGFTHFAVRPAKGAEARYEILTEASFVLRFLGVEKKINLKARDLVTDELALLEFNYDYRIDGSELVLSGRRDDDILDVTVISGGQPTRDSIAVKGMLHPSSVIALYPVVHGLRLGHEYRFQVYDGQLQTVAEVEQRVDGYEASEFFSGNAYKLSTTMHGQRTTTWIDNLGRPVFELALRGVMIAALEDETAAKRYVALAALNKQENLIEFSLIKPDAPIPNPRRVAFMKVVLSGLERLPPMDRSQRCQERGDEKECEIVTRKAGAAAAPDGVDTTVPRKYLEPSLTVQSNDPNIRITAREIAAGSMAPAEQVARLLKWMQDNIEKAPLDVFSALDVLEKRKAECQGHAYLYTALARALGIPTRVVNGLVYSEQLEGFLYHSWVESWIAGEWLAVDPTFDQTSADATHIKLLEGEALSDLLPLLDWVGKLKIRVLTWEHQRQ